MGAVLNDRHEDAAPYILGAALAALVLPALVLGLSAPLWLGVMAALLIVAGAIVAARLRRRRETLALAPPGRRLPARAALADAHVALAHLDASAHAIHARDTRRHAQRIADAARVIVHGVDADPAALAAMQRVLTYYLPRAAAIVESYRVLEGHGGDPARLRRIEAILAKLDAAFHHYADRLADDALRLLDVEIRLVDAALKDDLGDASR